MKTHKLSTRFNLLSFIIILAILPLSSGCSYYLYNTETSPEAGLDKITQEDYLIFHFQETTWHLFDLVIDSEEEVLQGTKFPVSPKHQGHDDPEQSANRYKPEHESPTNEIHIYINNLDQQADNEVTIPFAAIERIDIYDKDTQPIKKSAKIISKITFWGGLALIIINAERILEKMFDGFQLPLK